MVVITVFILIDYSTNTKQLATRNIVSTSDKSDQIIQFLSLPATANSMTDQWTLKTIELVLSIFNVSVCVYH